MGGGERGRKVGGKGREVVIGYPPVHPLCIGRISTITNSAGIILLARYVKIWSQ